MHVASAKKTASTSGKMSFEAAVAPARRSQRLLSFQGETSWTWRYRIENLVFSGFAGSVNARGQASISLQGRLGGFVLSHFGDMFSWQQWASR